MDIRWIFSNALIIDLQKIYNENINNISKMFEIQKKVLESNARQIRINATECEYISPTCLTILSSVRLIAIQQSKDIKIVIKGNSKFQKLLIEKGFINVSKESKEKSYIPLQLIKDEDSIVPLVSELVELSPLKDKMESEKNIIKSKLYEIAINPINHSKSNSGAIYSGYYRKKSEFYFSVYDMGIGIPQSVRNFKSDNSIDSETAIRWALESGHTTMNSDYSRGIGFSLLEEFRGNYKGTITIISEDIVYEATGTDNSTFKKIENKIPGTLFTLKIMV